MATPKDVPGINHMSAIAAYNRGRQDAQTEARRAAKKEMLDILEVRYMDETIERGSPTAVAILTVAKEVAEEYRARGV